MKTDGRGSGKVYIVGAGPGDPELLTLKARRLIDGADVIYYDALVSTAVLAGVRAHCVFVGKRSGFHLYEQDEINRLLATAALDGNTVVRLKGGDPFLFGRGGEEAVYLHERGVEYEVVPGVSAAFGAAASISLPLTHRGISSSLSICTGSPSAKIAFPDTDTVIYYMASRSIREVVSAAIAQGMSEEKPVALVHNASLPDERAWILTARELLEGTGEFPSPLLVVLGDVVKVAESLRANTEAARVRQGDAG